MKTAEEILDKYAFKAAGKVNTKDALKAMQEYAEQQTKQMLDCIHNLMAILDSPVGRKRNPGELTDEARNIARDILETNGISLYPTQAEREPLY